MGTRARAGPAVTRARWWDEWWVIHSIPRGSRGTGLDHLVLGVGGLFTVNTKNVSGNVWVGRHVIQFNGKNFHCLDAARHEAPDTARRLIANQSRTWRQLRRASARRPPL